MVAQGRLIATFDKKKRLGEVLTERGKLSAADLANALQLQKEKSGFLGELLLQSGLVSKEDLVTHLGGNHRGSLFDLRADQCSKTCDGELSSSLAAREGPKPQWARRLALLPEH